MVFGSLHFACDSSVEGGGNFHLFGLSFGLEELAAGCLFGSFVGSVTFDLANLEFVGLTADVFSCESFPLGRLPVFLKNFQGYLVLS